MATATADGAQGLWHLPCRFRSCRLHVLPRQPSSKRHYESRKLPALLQRLELPKRRSFFAIRTTTLNRFLAASFVIHFCSELPRPLPPPGEEHLPQLLQNRSIEAVKMAVNGEYRSFAHPPLLATGKRAFVALENHGEHF